MKSAASSSARRRTQLRFSAGARSPTNSICSSGPKLKNNSSASIRDNRKKRSLRLCKSSSAQCSLSVLTSDQSISVPSTVSIGTLRLERIISFVTTLGATQDQVRTSWILIHTDQEFDRI